MSACHNCTDPIQCAKNSHCGFAVSATLASIPKDSVIIQEQGGTLVIPPGPLATLGKRLTELLDDDKWNNVEPLLVQIGKQLAAAPVAQEPSPEFDYAKALATLLHKRYYPKVKDWKALDSTIGVLTQIDNMISGLQKSAVPEATPTDWSASVPDSFPAGVTDYRKKPVVIQAIKWTGANLRAVIDFTGLHESASKWTWAQYVKVVERDGLKIFTLEGPMHSTIGDYIIRGVKGEFYACKPDVFAQTYELASPYMNSGDAS